MTHSIRAPYAVYDFRRIPRVGDQSLGSYWKATPMTTISSRRKVTTWVIVLLMLVVVCSPVVGSQHDKLGEDAGRAIGQWPAAQQANESWEWVRILVYLVQIALSAQGFDPGKPDGVMGPNTMMALLEWRRVRADRTDEAWHSLAGSISHLLHATLRKMRLSPGPRDQILGPQSVVALERWDGTFLVAGYYMGKSETDQKAAREILLEDFGHTSAPVARAAKRDRSHDVDEGQDRAIVDNSGEGEDVTHCVKFAWEERFAWRDDVYQTEVQEFRVVNTCDFRIWFAWKDNGLAFPPDQDFIYFRPPVSSCSLADDQQYPPRGGIMDVRTVDQRGPHFSLHVNGRIFLLKGDIARVNYCAQVYEEEIKGQVDWRPPDCVYRMPRPCGDDSN